MWVNEVNPSEKSTEDCIHWSTIASWPIEDNSFSQGVNSTMACGMQKFWVEHLEWNIERLTGDRKRGQVVKSLGENRGGYCNGGEWWESGGGESPTMHQIHRVCSLWIDSTILRWSFLSDSIFSRCNQNPLRVLCETWRFPVQDQDAILPWTTIVSE